jgi:replicative DNA helicase
MTDIQTNIIASFCWSDNARVYLNQIEPKWFAKGFPQETVRLMKDLYRSGETFSLNELIMLLPKHKKSLVQVYSAMTTDKSVERDLMLLELKYKHNRIIQRLPEIDTKGSLSEIQNKLTEILEESKIESTSDITDINIVAGHVLDDINHAIERGEKLQGISTGWRYLDKYIGGYHKGNMIVIGGRPGAGKSALGLCLAIDCCKWAKVLFITLEMTQRELAQRYISYFANIENYKIRNANMTLDDIEDIATQMYQNELEINIMDSHDRRLDRLITKIKLHKAKHGLNIVFIDYLQLLETDGKTRYDKVSEASKRLKQLAKEENITIVALAQLRREDRSNVKPTLSDLKESGQIEQDADCVLFPYRPQYYETVRDEVELDAELIIAKNRHGQCADIPISFEGRYTKYKEQL